MQLSENGRRSIKLPGCTRLPVPHPMAEWSHAISLRAEGKIQGSTVFYAGHKQGGIMLRPSDFIYPRYVEDDCGCREKLFGLRNDLGEFCGVAGHPQFAQALRGFRDRPFARTIDASRSILERRLHF